MQKSTRKAYYAVVGFKRVRGGIAVEQTLAASGERSAIRMAERLASNGVGAVAFSRVGDPEFDDFDEPVEVVRFGDVPDNLQELMAA